METKNHLGKTLLILISVCVAPLTSCGLPSRFTEDWAIGSLIAVRRAQEQFKKANGRYGCREELTRLDPGVPSATQNGYQFAVRTYPTSFVAIAVPLRCKHQSMSLFLDQSGIIRGMYKNGHVATAEDPPLRALFQPRDLAKNIE